MSKSVSLSDEAYDRLKTWKRSDDESFSSVILRVLPKFRTFEEVLDDLAKDGGGLSEEEAEKMKEDLE